MIDFGGRTVAQLALAFIGIIVWGYGQRIDDSNLTLTGIAFFAAATLLRLLRRGRDRSDEMPEPDDHERSE